MFRMRRLHPIFSTGCYVVSVGAKFIENRVIGEMASASYIDNSCTLKNAVKSSFLIP